MALRMVGMVMGLGSGIRVVQKQWVRVCSTFSEAYGWCWGSVRAVEERNMYWLHTDSTEVMFTVSVPESILRGRQGV